MRQRLWYRDLCRFSQRNLWFSKTSISLFKALEWYRCSVQKRNVHYTTLKSYRQASVQKSPPSFALICGHCRMILASEDSMIANRRAKSLSVLHRITVEDWRAVYTAREQFEWDEGTTVSGKSYCSSEKESSKKWQRVGKKEYIGFWGAWGGRGVIRWRFRGPWTLLSWKCAWSIVGFNFNLGLARNKTAWGKAYSIMPEPQTQLAKIAISAEHFFQLFNWYLDSHKFYDFDSNREERCQRKGQEFFHWRSNRDRSNVGYLYLNRQKS